MEPKRSKGFCDPLDAIAAELGILFAGFQAGEDAALLPDTKKAMSAMAQAYKLVMDTQDDRDGADLAGNDVDIGKGKIEFKDVRFRYPTRPEAEVLKGMSFTIEGGTTVAIVGGSGGGKSTILGLLQKLYHPSSGHVLVDGIDIAGAQRDYLRSQLAVVPQEPKLFNLSVRIVLFVCFCFCFVLFCLKTEQIDSFFINTLSHTHVTSHFNCIDNSNSYHYDDMHTSKG